MTDRELLELAAKAADIKLLFDPYATPRDCTGMDPAMNIFAAKVWHPLTDDGDALRLAVKLGMCVTHFPEHMDVVVGYRVGKAGRNETVLVDDAVNFDPYAATRRAIVRAAAEIGKGMK